MSHMRFNDVPGRQFATVRNGLLLVALMLLSTSSALAQSAATTSASYPLRMDTQRVSAMVKASVEGLSYVPGEVLVKFKDGVGVSEQQNALRSLRSRPTVDGLRWQGNIALLTDRSEDDAVILAERLSQQPEVEYAEPNYLHHLNKTPNDPGFSTRQWNF